MAIIYNVYIEPTTKANLFRITWKNIEKNAEDYFYGTLAIPTGEIESLWHNKDDQLKLGEKLYHFLDGEARHLKHAMRNAEQRGESLQLNLIASLQTSDWPFELLAEDGIFLLPHKLHLVRRVSDWGAPKFIPPADRPLKLLFMVCSPIDVRPELNYEVEEEAIFRIAEKLVIDMVVEESGSLEGLRRQLEKDYYDVVHLSGHTSIKKDRGPYFIMEDETGNRHLASPDQLWTEAFIENPPRLVILSSPGEGPLNHSTVSYSRLLVENYNIPAALGWGRPLSDEQSTSLAGIFYRELSRGKSVLDSLQRARYELLKTFPSTPNPVWPQLRLFSSGMPLNAVVKPGLYRKPSLRQLQHNYLQNSRVKVLTEGFVGRRRQLKQSMKALKQDFDKVGVLILGMAGLGKSCLAGKICERFPHHTLIIVHGHLNAITLNAALKDAFIVAQDEKGQKILSQEKQLEKILAELCATSFKEKNYLLLFDDFDCNLEGVDEGQSGPLQPEAAELMRVLLRYLPFSGKMTQLIVTSRYYFFITEMGRDLIKERLGAVWLTVFQEPEQLQKARQLPNIYNYRDQSIVPRILAAGHGNPRLMEWLDILMGQMAEIDVSLMLEAMKNKQEEFIHKHCLRELLKSGGDALENFLRGLSIYRQPIHIEGVQKTAVKTGLETWQELLRKGIDLSLVEYDQALQRYQVTPLLREELSKNIEDLQTLHQAAFEYYSKICDEKEPMDFTLVEEWIYHALGCGEENTASKQGGALVEHLRERLALQESKRVGEWILSTKKNRLSSADDAYLLNAFAVTLHVLGEHQPAVTYLEQALDIWEKMHEEVNENVAIVLNNLGTVWEELGDAEKAVQYYDQALSINETIYGAEHANVAVTFNNLGSAWSLLGDHHKAIEYYQKALWINENLYGLEHTNVAITFNKLGSAWDDLGDYHKAIDYYEKALTIHKTNHGENHPDVAIVLNNLGETWGNLGNPQKAIRNFEEALRIDLRVYGEKHPNVARGLNNLGSTWEARGDYRKASEYYQQALDIDRNIYGVEHPRVAQDLNNLGSIWSLLGDHRKASEYFQQALDIDRATFGDEHPNFARDLRNLGNTWGRLGNPKQAITCYEKALSIDLKIFSDNHPTIADDLRNVGAAYKALGDAQKAIDCFERALSIDQAVFGNIHPQVAKSKTNLGTAWVDLGNNEKALRLFKEALSINLSILGEEHPEVAIIFKNIGFIYSNLGQDEEAFQSFSKAYEIAIKYLGPQHPLAVEIAEGLSKYISKSITIQIDGGSGFFVDEEKELKLKITNRSMINIDNINIELDSSSQYNVHNKHLKYQIEKLEGSESQIIHIPIRVSVQGEIPLNLKLFDKYYTPPLFIYSYEDNPYIYGPPIKDNYNFFGRKDECQMIINEICGETGPHRLLIGEQRSGKTSFLYCLKNSLHPPITPIYISIEKMPCPEEKNNDEIQAFTWLLDRLIYELAKIVKLDAKKYSHLELKFGDYFERYLSEIIDDIKSHKKDFRLCLLLDEGNRILKIREDFQLVLRATLNELGKNIRLVLACSNQFLDYVQESKSSPLKNIFQYTLLKPLEKEELNQLITQPASRLGYHYDPEAIHLLEQLSGGHLFYCQALCAESFNIARRQKTCDITKKIVFEAKELIINKKDVKDKFIMGYWDLIKDSREDIFCLKAILGQKKIEKAYHHRLERLVNRQIIKKTDEENYSITSELFKGWLCELLRIKC